MSNAVLLVNRMSYDYYIGVIDEESVLAECGPMRLIIRAWNKGKPQIHLAYRAAEQSFMYLERIARHRPELSRPFPKIETPPPDALAIAMVQSVDAVGDGDLTPMAAVAGTIADAVADWLFEMEVTRVIVDNGGDIAIRIAKGETVNVGIRPSIRTAAMSHVLGLDSRTKSWGVTTSGFGGRSLTRGIASAATVIAANASVADAASTAIANACLVKDENIRQKPAEQIDLGTDLGGIPVTSSVGKLSPAQLEAALETALHRAEDLVVRNVIFGAIIYLGKSFVMTSSLKTFVSRISLAADGQEAFEH